MIADNKDGGCMDRISTAIHVHVQVQVIRMLVTLPV
jgi:hypothetical protein